MIRTTDVEEIARARLQDADILLTSERYDGAIYLCGYAVELALKARIC
jgi:HEPN domain-containing protein